MSNGTHLRDLAKQSVHLVVLVKDFVTLVVKIQSENIKQL